MLINGGKEMKRLFARALRLLSVVVMVVTLAPTTANAAAPTTLATLDGKLFNLAQGWGKAQSCAVFDRGDVRCFSTHKQLDDLLGYSRSTDSVVLAAQAQSPAAAAAAIPACASGWFCIYEAINGGGRRLIFRDEYWQSLAEYAFEDVVSSYRNNQGSADTAGLCSCNSSLGWHLTISARTISNNIGPSYNDQADRVLG